MQLAIKSARDELVFICRGQKTRKHWPPRFCGELGVCAQLRKVLLPFLWVEGPENSKNRTPVSKSLLYCLSIPGVLFKQAQSGQGFNGQATMHVPSVRFVERLVNPTTMKPTKPITASQCVGQTPTRRHKEDARAGETRVRVHVCVCVSAAFQFR